MTQSQTSPWQAQPHAIVERDGVQYTLLGTAHVSHSSVEAVEDAIDSGDFDTVAVELDEARLQALTDPDSLAKLDLVQVIRKGRVAMFAANLALAAYQRRLAEQLGIEPGAELKRAAAVAKERGLGLELIDREVGLTFRRASSSLGFFGKMKLAAGLMAGLFSNEEMEEDEIEKLKEGDILEATFGEFAESSPALYESVIAERDRYMAARLRDMPPGPREVLAVVGAGHLKGLAAHLRGLATGHDAAAGKELLLLADARRFGYALPFGGLLLLLVHQLRERHAPVACGVFAADMQVHLVNDGPVTFMLQQ